MLWLWLVLGAALLLALVGSFFFFRFACDARLSVPGFDGSPWEPYKDLFQAGRDWLAAQPQEEVFLQSRDGLRLRGVFVPHGDSRATVLLMHGYRAKGGIADFSVILPYYASLGLNILLIDERACGESEGRYICFGVQERYDCADWCAYLDGRFGGDCRILLDGISMGASTVLMASGLPLPQSVCAIVADCGFVSPWQECRYVAKQMHLPLFLLPLVDVWCRLLAKFSLREASTTAALAVNRRPILFLHGEDDTFVPCAASKENFAACTAEKELYLVPGAGHALSYLLDMGACKTRLRSFVARYVLAPRP